MPNVRGRPLNAVLLTAFVIAGCGSATRGTDVDLFVFQPSAGKPTVLADPTMRRRR